MDDKHLRKLDTQAFRTVSPPPRLHWQKQKDRNGQAPPKENRWKSVAGRTLKRLRSEKPPGNKSGDGGYRRLMIKTGICAAIAVLILGLLSIDSPMTNTVTEAVSDAVSHEFDIEEDIGRLKFVQNLSDEVQSVFSPMPDDAFVFPADGEVVTHFGEGGSRGVRIAAKNAEAVSVGKGTVLSVGEISDSGFVKIALDNGAHVIYHNLAPAVAVDDIVRPGQPVGSVLGETLYMEVKDGETYIDPIDYIQQRVSAAHR